MLRPQSEAFADTSELNSSLKAKTIKSRKDLDSTRFDAPLVHSSSCKRLLGTLSSSSLLLYFHRATETEISIAPRWRLSSSPGMYALCELAFGDFSNNPSIKGLTSNPLNYGKDSFISNDMIKWYPIFEIGFI